MYATVFKGVTILGQLRHSLKLFSLLIPGVCPVALLPFLVGFRYNNLLMSLQVVKLKIKFCSSPNFSSSSGVYYRIVMIYKLRSRLTLDMMAVGNLNALTARNYYTLATPRRSMDLAFVTGFADGEGCFGIKITKNNKCKTGFKVGLFFSIALHEIDKALLEQIKNKLKVGSVYRQGKNAIQFWVQSIKELKIIFDHFDKYPLITDKLADYLLLKKAFYLLSQK